MTNLKERQGENVLLILINNITNNHSCKLIKSTSSKPIITVKYINR